MDVVERFNQGERVTWFGIFANLVLTVFKYAAGFLGRSQAMLADATESLSDLISTGMIMISLKVSRKPVDPEHPYGHGKAESLATGGVALFVVAGGLLILFTTARSLIAGPRFAPGLVALGAAIITILVKEALYQYTAIHARRLKSSVLQAAAWDHRKDALNSIGTLVGIGGARLGYRFLDPLAGAIMSLFILKIGYDVMTVALRELMDTMPEQPTAGELMSICEGTPGVEHVYGIRARRMGQYVFVDLKIDIDPNLTVQEGHAIAKAVKNKVIDRVDNVADVIVHVNPHFD